MPYENETTSDRMRELATAIAAAKREIKRIERQFNVDDCKKELKALLAEVEANEKQQRVVEFRDAGVRVVLYPTTTEYADKKKAKTLLAHQTYRAIFKPRTSERLLVSEID
jgi:hypothetical protein